MLRPIKAKKSTGETDVCKFILYVSCLDNDKRDRQAKAEPDVDIPDEIKYAYVTSRRDRILATDEIVQNSKLSYSMVEYDLWRTTTQESCRGQWIPGWPRTKDQTYWVSTNREQVIGCAWCISYHLCSVQSRWIFLWRQFDLRWESITVRLSSWRTSSLVYCSP